MILKKIKGSIAINQTFLLVLAVIVLVVLVALSFFLGDRAEELIMTMKSLISPPEVS